MNHYGTSRDQMLRTWPWIKILNNYSPKWYREGKKDSQWGFIHFHPIYYLKGDRALGNSILRNSSSECQNQDQHSFIARANTDWNSLPNGVIEKQSVKAVCENGRQVPSLKTLTLGLFIIIFFYYLLNTRTLIIVTFSPAHASAVIGYPPRRYKLTRLELAEAIYASVRT